MRILIYVNYYHRKFCKVHLDILCLRYGYVSNIMSCVTHVHNHFVDLPICWPAKSIYMLLE